MNAFLLQLPWQLKMSSNAETRLDGALPVLHTPLTDRGEIDAESLQAEIDWVFGVGAEVDRLFVRLQSVI